jgi:hypothetical protein
MFLRVTTDGSIVYPFDIDLLRLENPTVSLPQNLIPHLESFGVHPVTPTIAPEYDPLFRHIQEVTPTKTPDGSYAQEWFIAAKYLPEEEAPLRLQYAKKQKLSQIENEWATLESAGWDSGQGYHLGITPSDVALIVGVFSLAREASAMGMPLPKLISMENNSIEFETIQDMTVLLMYYGNARSDMAKNFAQKRKAVEAATTIEEVNAIS